MVKSSFRTPVPMDSESNTSENNIDEFVQETEIPEDGVRSSFKTLEEFFALFTDNIPDFSVSLVDWRKYKRGSSKSKPISYSKDLRRDSLEAMIQTFSEERFADFFDDDTIEQYVVSTTYEKDRTDVQYHGVPLGVYETGTDEFTVLDILYKTSYLVHYIDHCNKTGVTEIPYLRDGSGVEIKLSYRKNNGYADTRNAIVIKTVPRNIFEKIPQDFTPRFK